MSGVSSSTPYVSQQLKDLVKNAKAENKNEKVNVVNQSEADIISNKISEEIEQKIQENIPEIEHVTIHLEPFLTVPKNLNVEDKITEEKIREILEQYTVIKKIGRIVSLNFENILKIDIDCSFDKELSIEKVHDMTSEIEHAIRTQIKNAVITIHPEPV